MVFKSVVRKLSILCTFFRKNMSVEQVKEAMSLSRSSLFYNSNILSSLDPEDEDKDDDSVEEMTKMLYFLNFEVGAI